MTKPLWSCDWGTSSFRLRLVDQESHQVLAGSYNGKGIAATLKNWKTQAESNKISRQVFYLQQIQQQIGNLRKQIPSIQEDVPIVISGMASSSIGFTELPYARLPFPLDGSQTHVQCLDLSSHFKNLTLLVSGISNQEDVIRGEETQLIGLADSRHGLFNVSNTLCILPGTHSKHIQIQYREIIGFKTYMTGELFNLMANHSILKDAVSNYGDLHQLRPSDRKTFHKGLIKSLDNNLLHSMFSVRINQLFEFMNKRENYLYLSGLLIGTELGSLLHNTPERVILCSGSNVYPFYHLALELLGLLPKTTLIEPMSMDTAVVDGHIRIFQQWQSQSAI